MMSNRAGRKASKRLTGGREDSDLAEADAVGVAVGVEVDMKAGSEDNDNDNEERRDEEQSGMRLMKMKEEYDESAVGSRLGEGSEMENGFGVGSVPPMSEVELENAIFSSVIITRPIGPHKHVLIIQLQKEFHSRTGYWMPTEKLWEKVHDVWDVAGLEGLSSPSGASLPGEPDQLSPLPPTKAHRRVRERYYRKHSNDDMRSGALDNSRHQAASESQSRSASGSLSPLSDAEGAKPQKGKNGTLSKSAQCLNSRHFRETFSLPYLRLGSWQEKGPAPSGRKRREGNGNGNGNGIGGEAMSRSDNNSSTHTAQTSQSGSGTRTHSTRTDAHPAYGVFEMDDEEEDTWEKMIYQKSGQEGLEDEVRKKMDEEWEAEVEKQLESRREAQERGQGRNDTEGQKKRGPRASDGPFTGMGRGWRKTAKGSPVKRGGSVATSSGAGPSVAGTAKGKRGRSAMKAKAEQVMEDSDDEDRREEGEGEDEPEEAASDGDGDDEVADADDGELEDENEEEREEGEEADEADEADEDDPPRKTTKKSKGKVARPSLSSSKQASTAGETAGSKARSSSSKRKRDSAGIATASATTSRRGKGDIESDEEEVKPRRKRR